MFQGVHLTQQQRKRSHDGSASASTSMSGEWLEKRKGKPPLALGRLVSGKLVMPGSKGSGLATLRGASQAASTSKSSSKKSSTLDAFFLQPKHKLAKSESGSSSTTIRRSSSSSSSASTKLQPRPMLEPEPKGKGREARTVLLPSSETEDDDDDEELAIESLLVPQPQPEHARNDVNLRSDPSPSTSTQFILPRMPTPAPGRSDPPELPFPEPEPKHAPTTFGFAPSAFVKAQSSPDNGSSAPASPPAKKRRVIETSSPVLDPATSPQQAQRRARVLASPSSAHSPVQTAFRSDEEPDDEPIVKPATAAAAGRQGSRIPWDTDDESSYARLNAVPSASQVAREVIAQRVQRKPLSPRKLPTVQAETTSYMDRFREESYSPVQYTWTESFADNVRGRLGMSPKKGRRQPQHLRWRKGGGTARQQPRAESWFDESATEHSSSSQSPSQQPAPLKQKQNAPPLAAAVAVPAISNFVVHAESEPAALVPAIDDSGFLDACPSPLSAGDGDEVLAPDSRPNDDERPEEESIPSSQPDLPDGMEEEMSLFPETFMPTSHLTHGRERGVLTGLLDYARAPHAELEPSLAEENQMNLDESVADSQPASFKAGESQEQVENELLGRAGGRVILAPDTQEVLNTETQDVSARETQWDTLPLGRHAAAEQELLAPESENQLDFFAETLPPQQHRQGRPRASVSASIAAGWFTDVLADARTAEAAARAAPQQVEITEFFAPKHLPSKAAEGGERLARAVREQRTERKRVTFIPPPENAVVFTKMAEAAEEDEEEEEVIADSESEEDHLLERLEYELSGLGEVDASGLREAAHGLQEEAEVEETQAVPSSQTQALPLLASPLPAGRELEMHLAETQVVADSDVDEDEQEIAEDMVDLERDDSMWPL